eukprot:10044376-Karenia_brevis.AAC.1
MVMMMMMMMTTMMVNCCCIFDGLDVVFVIKVHDAILQIGSPVDPDQLPYSIKACFYPLYSGSSVSSFDSYLVLYSYWM